ncbi:MAG: hypothetical protein KGL35_30105, partial [Bradyrhizobium sp.]|nr:hypothetical protein [Bradyrhizobium sp.]
YRPLASWEDDQRVHVPTLTVMEPERKTRYSGLLDAHGNKLMVEDRMESIGFVIFHSHAS